MNRSLRQVIVTIVLLIVSYAGGYFRIFHRDGSLAHFLSREKINSGDQKQQHDKNPTNNNDTTKNNQFYLEQQLQHTAATSTFSASQGSSPLNALSSSNHTSTNNLDHKKEKWYDSDKAIEALHNCHYHTHYRPPRVHTFIYKNQNYSISHIAKCGSSTIRNFVATALNGVDWTTYEPDNAIKIAFVRGPISRFLSAYTEIRRPALGYIPTFPDNIQKDFDRFLTDYYKGHYVAGNNGIREHFRSQIQSISYTNGTAIDLNYIGRSERIDNEWNYLLRKQYPDLPPMPDGVRFREGLEEKPKLFSLQQYQKICDLYCTDYCCLNIPFPQQCPNSTCPCDSEMNNKLRIYDWL